MNPSSVGGLVLCGGQSRRMGQPKAWLPVGREVMLQRVVRIVGEVVRPVIVVAADGQELPPLPADVEIVRESGERGPLQGIVTGMKALEGRVDAVYVSGCDVPLLQAEFVRSIVNHLASGGRESPESAARSHVRRTPDGEGEPFPACSGDLRPPLASVPLISGRLHPLAAVYSLSALPLVTERLGRGQLRLTDLFDHLPTLFLEENDLREADPELSSMMNVNTPEEYHRLNCLRTSG